MIGGVGRTPPEAFPALVSGIADPEVRALFSYRFLEASEVYDELVDAAALRILNDAGALPAPEGETPEEAVRRRGFGETTLPVLRYLYAKLAGHGVLSEDEGRFRPGTLETGDVSALAQELATREPEAGVGAEIVTALVNDAPAFFRGEKSGEDILFVLQRLPLWFRYFSNENLLYAINNALGAVALRRALPERGAEVLEVGGGCGSAAETALKHLDGRLSRYRFTELVPTFARRGERAARAAASNGTVVEAGRLDMTRPWAEQGIVPGSFDAVYSVNCFHVAPDLDQVLAEAAAALKPGGAVVVSECVRPTALRRPSYVEFVFSFLPSFTGVRTHPERRPTPGFLTPEAWRRSFEAAGLPDVEVLPDVDAVARDYPDFFVGAVIARRRA